MPTIIELGTGAPAQAGDAVPIQRGITNAFLTVADILALSSFPAPVAITGGGNAPPAFTVRSAGTRMIYSAALDGTHTDYATGIDTGTLWNSVPTPAEAFKWYGGTTLAATLTGLGALTVASVNLTGATIPANGSYLPAANTYGVSVASGLAWQMETQGPSTRTNISATITPAGTTTWYRIGQFAAGNQAQCADIYFFVSRVLGGGLQQLKLRISKATTGGGTPGVTAKLEGLGAFFGVASCLSQIRVVQGGVNAASFIDVTFASTDQHSIAVQVHNMTATKNSFFVVDPAFTSQGVGAAGFPIDCQTYQDALFNDLNGWYRASDKAGTTTTSKNFSQTRVYVHGLNGDGVTDDAPAIQNALNNAQNGTTVVLPAGTFRVAFGITVPPYKTLAFESYGMDAATGQCIIQADLAVTPVVQINGGGAAASSVIRGIAINRAAGVIPAGCIGLVVNGGAEQMVEDVTIYRAAIGIKLNGAFDARINRLVTTQITDTHHQIVNSQECRFISCRAGKGGGLDVNCNAYTSVQGNSDTISYTSCQFNQSAGLVAQLLSFDNYASANGIVTYSQCHFELVSNGIQATGTTATVQRLGFYGCQFNLQPTATVLTAGTATWDQFVIAGSPFIQGTLNVTGLLNFSITDNTWVSAVTISGGRGSFSHNKLASTLTVTGACLGVVIAGNSLINASAFTDTSTGRVRVYGNVINDPTLDAGVTDRLNRLTVINVARSLVQLTYSASITPDASLGEFFKVLVTNGTAFTINNPTNMKDGQEFILRIANTSGGAMGAVTFGAAFKMPAFVAPANGFNRTHTFHFDGGQVIEDSRSSADTPN